MIPIDRNHRWNLAATASTAVVDYLPGLEQPGNWNTGLGAGIFYKTPALKIMVGYGYGVDAIRSDGRGAQSIGILLQFDLGEAREALFNPEQPGRWRGLQELPDILGK